MKKYKIILEVPDSYEPLLCGNSATAFFFDVATGEARVIDGELIEDNDDG